MDLPPTLPIPDEIMEIARTLEGAGFETWCVGGAVRDHLLGLEDRDFDLATAARPEDVRRLFRRTVPVGIEHGTIAVLDRENRAHEVTTFRRDVKTDGRHAVVEFGVTLEQDLARRDFTINAIAYHPQRVEWRDPTGGVEDLERRLVRAVGDPAQRFREDYLRILRALRFAARFGFVVEERTLAAARAEVEGLRHLSAERVRDEWFKGLTTAQRPGELALMWESVGASRIWLPEIGELGGAGVPGRPAVLDRLAPRDPVLITSYLSSRPGETLARLRSSNAEVERGTRIGALRDQWPDAVSERSVRRWLARVGGAADDLIAIAVAEQRGDDLAAAVRQVRQSGAPITIRDLAVGGEQVIGAGVPRGPLVGKVLRRLLDEVLDDPTRNRPEYLLQRARSLVNELSVAE